MVVWSWAQVSRHVKSQVKASAVPAELPADPLPTAGISCQTVTADESTDTRTINFTCEAALAKHLVQWIFQCLSDCGWTSWGLKWTKLQMKCIWGSRTEVPFWLLALQIQSTVCRCLYLYAIRISRRAFFRQICWGGCIMNSKGMKDGLFVPCTHFSGLYFNSFIERRGKPNSQLPVLPELPKHRLLINCAGQLKGFTNG